MKSALIVCLGVEYLLFKMFDNISDQWINELRFNDAFRAIKNISFHDIDMVMVNYLEEGLVENSPYAVKLHRQKKIDSISAQNTQVKGLGIRALVFELIKVCLTFYEESLRNRTQAINNNGQLRYKLCLI